jgi:hypothetical protein
VSSNAQIEESHIENEEGYSPDALHDELFSQGL